jgi:hypothetical protein
VGLAALVAADMWRGVRRTGALVRLVVHEASR